MPHNINNKIWTWVRGQGWDWVVQYVYIYIFNYSTDSSGEATGHSMGLYLTDWQKWPCWEGSERTDLLLHTEERREEIKRKGEKRERDKKAGWCLKLGCLWHFRCPTEIPHRVTWWGDLGVEGRMKGRRASGIRSGDGIKFEPCYPRMLPLTAAPGVVASKPCVWLQPAALALSRTDSAL